MHNCLDPVQASRFGAAAGVWNVIHAVGAFRVIGVLVIVGYPLVPWIAAMAAGFCLGRIFLMEASARQRILIVMGTALTLGFVVLRAVNVYGDPAPWAPQESGIYTVLSFLNCTKYPPSRCFLLIMLGPAMLALAAFDR